MAQTPFGAFRTAAPNMFGEANVPRQNNPLQGMPGMGDMGGMVQLLLPMLTKALGDKYGMVPGQFSGTQNMFDQFASRQYQQSQQTAMSGGQRQDQVQIQQLLAGMTRLTTKEEVTPQQQQQNFKMAQQMQTMLPMMATMLGPATVDKFFGARGSATVMASNIHKGMRGMRDPVTGAQATSGETAGYITNEIFTQMYGPNADIGQMRGMGAGQAGALFQQLTQRGMIGGATVTDRMNSLQEQTFSQANRRRMATAELRNQGRDVNEAAVRSMTTQMFEGEMSTMGRIRSGRQITGDEAEGMRNLPGMDTMLRQSDAQRVSSKLKGMAGAVSAMQEIFGSATGRQGSMGEIMAALDAITGSQFANMSPARVEQMVRTTRNLAEASGVGLQGMGALTGMINQRLRAGGVSGAATMFVTQQAMAQGVGFQNAGMGGVTGVGALSRQESVIMQSRMGAGAANSQQANAQFAILSMMDTLGEHVDPDSKMARVAAALRSGDQEVTYKDPKTGEMVTERLDQMDLSNAAVGGMAEDAGLERATARAVLSDRMGNADQINTIAGQNAMSNTMRRQRTKDMREMSAATFGGALRSLIGERSKVGAALTKAGVKRGADDLSRIGQQLFTQAMEMTPTQMDDPNKRKEVMRNNLRDALMSHARSSLEAQGLDENEIEARMEGVRASLDNATVDQMVIQQTSRFNNALLRNPRTAGLKSIEGAYQVMSPRAMGAREQAARAEVNKSRVQRAFDTLGKTGPLRRMSDLIRNAKPGDDIGKMIGTALGFISKDDLRKLEEGPIGALRDAQVMMDADISLSGSRMHDATGQITKAGQRTRDIMALAATGMTEGGTAATDALAQMTYEITGKEFDRDDPEALLRNIDSKLKGGKLSKKETTRLSKLRNMAVQVQQARQGKTIPRVLEEMGIKEKADNEALELTKEADSVKKAEGFDRGKDVDKGAGSTQEPKSMELTGVLELRGLDKVLLAGIGQESGHEFDDVPTNTVSKTS